MAQLGRPGLSAAQKRELWQRWKAGQSLSAIGRALEKNSSSIHWFISTESSTSKPSSLDPVRRRAPFPERG